MTVSETRTPEAHTARLLPGGPVADAVFAEVTARVAALRRAGVVPSLATILVGDDPASAGYIRMKQQRAADLGFASPHIHLPGTARQADLVRAIREFNEDPEVHAILVQHPVDHLDYAAAILAIVRVGRRGDHAPGRRGRSDHRGDVVPQRRRPGRTAGHRIDR